MDAVRRVFAMQAWGRVVGRFWIPIARCGLREGHLDLLLRKEVHEAR